MPACANSTPACLSFEVNRQMSSLVFLRYEKWNKAEGVLTLGFAGFEINASCDFSHNAVTLN